MTTDKTLSLIEYTVDRYHRGKKLAESCVIKATNAAEALNKAKALYEPKHGFDERPMEGVTFVISEDFI